MPRPMKVCELVIDYAAFMLAIVLARLIVNVKLSENVNNLELSNCANFAVNCTALKHAFYLLGTAMKDRTELIEVQKQGCSTSDYFS